MVLILGSSLFLQKKKTKHERHDVFGQSISDLNSPARGVGWGWGFIPADIWNWNRFTSPLNYIACNNRRLRLSTHTPRPTPPYPTPCPVWTNPNQFFKFLVGMYVGLIRVLWDVAKTQFVFALLVWINKHMLLWVYMLAQSRIGRHCECWNKRLWKWGFPVLADIYICTNLQSSV